jgi:hypothetical protein
MAQEVREPIILLGETTTADLAIIRAQNSATGSAGSGTGHNHAHTLAGSLTGTVAVSSSGGALSGTVTAAGNNSFSPYVVVNYIIKH